MLSWSVPYATQLPTRVVTEMHVSMGHASAPLAQLAFSAILPQLAMDHETHSSTMLSSYIVGGRAVKAVESVRHSSLGYFMTTPDFR